MSILIVPPILAHRGARSFAPENTLAAFAMAKQCGLHWVELDVQLAACGEVIVFHDDTLDRTTNGTGPVHLHPYDYLKTLDAGSWFHPTFAEERIPTLQAVLQLLNQLDLAVNIEIKNMPGMEGPLVEKVVAVIQKSAFQPANFISSFSVPILERVRDVFPTAGLGFLMHTWQPDWSTVCDALRAVAVDVNSDILNAARVQEIKATGRALLSYTVNDPVVAKRLFSWGADAVFSDCPPLFLEAFGLQGPPVC